MEDFHQAINNPLDAVIDIRTGYIAEELPQKRVRFRYQFSGLLPAECGQGGIMQIKKEVKLVGEN